MRAGLLREKVTLMGVTTTQSASGAVKKTTGVLGIQRCWRKSKTDQTVLAGSEELQTGNLVLQLRNSPIAKNATYLVFDDVKYKIQSNIHQIQDNTRIITATKVNE